MYVTKAMVELQVFFVPVLFLQTVRCMDSNKVSYDFSLTFIEVELNGRPRKQKGKKELS